MTGVNDFVVVANRLPVDLTTDANGQPQWVPSPGGLVAALEPVLQQQTGCWVGWPGVADVAPEPFRTDSGIALHPVRLSQADYELFYEGFSNATLWPLYHDLIVKPEYRRDWWEAYQQVNARFAAEVDKVAAPNATVWVQDYQLQLVPGMLRQRRPDLKIGFFLHIPFPGADLFRQLPWREEIIEGLMGADLIGFHLESYAANFVSLCPQKTGEPGLREASARIQAPDGREIGVGAYPISIDPGSLGVRDEGSVNKLRRELGDPRTVLLGVDRLDYTKGILQRLEAFESLLGDASLDPDEVVLVQIATPSRERLEHYRRTKSAVEEAVGRINGRFGSISRPVVHYFHRSLPKQELQHYYRLADVMVVTPFKDGMNLVAKEYVACREDGSGALVLSEFAGAASELDQAYLCNPFDQASIKRAIVAAVRNEDPARMPRMHEQVRTHDVSLWARSFLSSLAGEQ